MISWDVQQSRFLYGDKFGKTKEDKKDAPRKGAEVACLFGGSFAAF